MSKTRAVFLDRDGVLNEMILNPRTGEYESPHAAADVKLMDGVVAGLAKLKDKFEFFVVSNQPSYAKGKCSMEDLREVSRRFEKLMSIGGITFRKVYYCYHHPEAVLDEMRKKCECRKPGNLFLREAAGEFGIDLKNSWMIGDRDIDVECGQTAGCKTILVTYEHSRDRQGKSKPTFVARNAAEAAEIISKQKGD